MVSLTKIKKWFPIWVEHGVATEEYELVVTDCFGVALEPGQSILYRKETSSSYSVKRDIYKGKICGISAEGSIFIEYYPSDTKTLTTTLSGRQDVLTSKKIGTSRYVQIKVVTEEG